MRCHSLTCRTGLWSTNSEDPDSTCSVFMGPKMENTGEGRHTPEEPSDPGVVGPRVPFMWGSISTVNVSGGRVEIEWMDLEAINNLEEMAGEGLLRNVEEMRGV